MTAWKRLLAIGGLVCLLGLLTTLPARVVHSWASPEQLKLAGIDGSLWNGSANEASIQGLYLQKLQWSFQPLSLPAGKLAYAVRAQPAGGFMEGRVAIGFGGKISIDGLNMAIPLSALQNAVRIDDVAGDITLRLDEVQLSDGWPTRVSGQAGVSGLVLRALSPAPLGNYKAEFQTRDDGVIGSVEDQGGMLKVAATLRLNPDRSYALIGQVGPTATASSTVVEQLGYLGSPDARGLREFRLEGSL
ncbi:MAG: type II secretion system protein N [Halioglobus sp.]|nr:type II secretion system protein N [Halioglobus sp.]